MKSGDQFTISLLLVTLQIWRELHLHLVERPRHRGRWGRSTTGPDRTGDDNEVAQT